MHQDTSHELCELSSSGAKIKNLMKGVTDKNSEEHKKMN